MALNEKDIDELETREWLEALMQSFPTMGLTALIFTRTVNLQGAGIRCLFTLLCQYGLFKYHTTRSTGKP